MRSEYGLKDLMPENLLADKNINKITMSLDKFLKGIYSQCDYPAILSRIDDLDSDTIDSLAWQYHVDFYDEEIPLQQRRELVKKSIDYHRHKGTKYAVDGVVGTVFPDATVHEFWEYGGKPYCFKVTTVNSAIPDEAHINRIVRAVNSVKNSRSYMDELSFIRKLEAKMYIGSYLDAMKRITVSPRHIQDTKTEGKIYAGFGLAVGGKTDVSPRHIQDTKTEGKIYAGFGLAVGGKTDVSPRSIKDTEVKGEIKTGFYTLSEHKSVETNPRISNGATAERKVYTGFGTYINEKTYVRTDEQESNGIMMHKKIVVMPKM